MTFNSISKAASWQHCMPKACSTPSKAAKSHPEEQNFRVFPGLESPPTNAGNNLLSSGTYEHHGWQLAWAQIIGPKHCVTEDTLGFAVQEGSGDTQSGHCISLVLADGVGGGARGDIASHALVTHCLHMGQRHAAANGQDREWLLKNLVEADQAVNRALAAHTDLPGAATLSAAWLDSCGRGWITRVGDARLSIYDPCTGQLAPLLADQSFANLGEKPPQPGHENAPARMVGAGLAGEPQLHSLTLKAGEILCLSSDGLHEWHHAFPGTTDSDSDACDKTPHLLRIARLMALCARQAGSDDDISVLLARAC